MLDGTDQSATPRLVSSVSLTPDEDDWREIRRRSSAMSFAEYARFVTPLVGGAAPLDAGERYALLQRTTEHFLTSRAGTSVAANPPVELIWSYWQEEGMLVPAIDAMLDLDPLRPLSDVLWGYVQDEPRRRVSAARRSYEYQHQYGLLLTGKAKREAQRVDGRTKFSAAFGELLYQTHVFSMNDERAPSDTAPILRALGAVHGALHEGSGNQFGDLPWQARSEMLVQQWLLAQPDMRQFLRGPTQGSSPEPWMASVDATNTLHRWNNVPVVYFNELAITSEQLLLSVRVTDWTTHTPAIAASAASWARFHREIVERYADAFHTVTGVDLRLPRATIARMG